jgi:hypothetical protein
MKLISLIAGLQIYSMYYKSDVLITASDDQQELIDYILPVKHYYNTFYLPSTYSQMRNHCFKKFY